MIIKNASVYTAEHLFEKKQIAIQNGRIVSVDTKLPAAVSRKEKEVIDGKGLLAIPGLVDIHLHGAKGKDVCDNDEAGLKTIAEFEASKGVLAICPATMTLPIPDIYEILQTAKEYRNKQHPADDGVFTTIGEADLVGIQLEGPFLSPYKCGAQSIRYLYGADYRTVSGLIKKSGDIIKILDIAPEMILEKNFIRKCSKKVKVSIAHTDCDYETASKAFAEGAKHVTHLYNAMNGIGHREPGPVIAAQEAGAEVELISDGVHVHPAMVRFTFNTFAKNKVILISDSMRACGMKDGEYMLGGQPVKVVDNKAVLAGNDKVIAGSVTNLFDCMKKAIEFGVAREDAVRAASENPAKAIGIEADYGSITPGCFGNVVLVDKDFNIRYIVQKGKIIFRAEEEE